MNQTNVTDKRPATSPNGGLLFAVVRFEQNFGRKITGVTSRHRTLRAASDAKRKFNIALRNRYPNALCGYSVAEWQGGEYVMVEDAE